MPDTREVMGRLTADPSHMFYIKRAFGPEATGTGVLVRKPDRANIVSSRLVDGRHAPVLDIDVPHRVIEEVDHGSPVRRIRFDVLCERTDFCALRAASLPMQIARMDRADRWLHDYGKGGLLVPILQLTSALPFDLLPSRTTGHSHLFIHRTCSWSEYLDFLNALENVGILTGNFVKWARLREQSIVMKPGQCKPDDAFSS